MGFNIDERYEELFDVEISAWCYGIEKYPGEVYPGLVHSIIAELKPSIRAAFQMKVAFDILEISTRISKSAKYLIHEKEVCFSLLAQFPNPKNLNEDGQYAMAQVIDQAEQEYGGVLDRLRVKWKRDTKLLAA